ncbi:MAG TPA: peptidyl-alpha-hydroxyglycine alpha-amidating lyase family protein, partial [Chitinophagaceae bacterium]|nr:peptidyl-alpha-hydroxyglycine alpha-amidating lyase family protein [Chitinophagaceae bacterium]
MIKKFFYGLLILTLLLVAGYFVQPVKKGRGLDPTTEYTLVEHWPVIPDSLVLGNPVGLGIDTARNIVVLHRAERVWPLMGSMPHEPIRGKTVWIIDREKGTLLHSWGGHRFIMPHGLNVDHENNIWITDVGLHQVFKFDHSGKLLMTLGEAGVQGSDRLHFNKPTDVAVAADGSFYVSDGYGNSRIVQFSPEGNYLREWGKKGSGEGEFNIPHALCLDGRGTVYVADRKNNRI